MPYDKNAREKEIENRLRKDYFGQFDAEAVLGDVDFAVAIPSSDGLPMFEQEWLLWAEAKKSNTHDLKESLVQLILTVGRSRIFEDHLPPAFIGAFDAEKIAFVPFGSVHEVFSLSYINWQVRPSDHQSPTFLLLKEKLGDALEHEMICFSFESDEELLRTFIRRNFVSGKSKTSKIRINKTNFTAIYQKWLKDVKPTINVKWEVARKQGIIEADFYLADIMSKDNVYLPLKDSLRVLLKMNHYEMDREINDMGFFVSKQAEFTDKQKAHQRFWNRYDRPPLKEYREYIVMRRDLLVPQDIREKKGSFFTPSQWVSLSQQYLSDEFGQDWQEEYYIWDCAAGTGNLLANLTNKNNLWASTLDKGDCDVMHDRIKTMNKAAEKGKQGSNLWDSHVFQFDFLNDPFSKLPPKLKEIIDDEEKRKKLIIYINPPYAEASNARTVTGTGNNRPGLSESMVKERYKASLGRAVNELFAQFFARIWHEIPNCHLAVFSTLKTLQGPNFSGFRKQYRAKLGRIFLVPANTFDNVKGSFPIGFQIWHTAEKDEFKEISADVYDANGVLLGKKKLHAYDDGSFIIDWLRQYYDKKRPKIGYVRYLGTDFQNNNGVFVTLNPSENDLKQVKGSWATANNLIKMCIYFSVRLSIDQTWLNDRDQFLYPNEGWEQDRLFQSDCLVYTLFHGQNRVSCKHGINHWIPFTEAEVCAKDEFSSNFMSEYIKGRVSDDFKKNIKPEKAKDGELFDEQQPEDFSIEPMVFSPEAQAVLDAGRELWRYYHQQPDAMADASFYDIRLHFQGVKVTANGKEQMNTESNDESYTELIGNLRQRMKLLAKRIEPKIYEYGFLKRNYELLPRLQEITLYGETLPVKTRIPSSAAKLKKTMPPMDEEAQVNVPSLAKVLNPTGGTTNVNITVNINKFEKPVGAVIQTGGNQEINEILDIKQED